LGRGGNVEDQVRGREEARRGAVREGFSAATVARSKCAGEEEGRLRREARAIQMLTPFEEALDDFPVALGDRLALAARA
jgi:hypothetical protein